MTSLTDEADYHRDQARSPNHRLQETKIDLGRDLFDFLQARRTKKKRPWKPNQMYCLRCREPKIPAGNMVDYQTITESLGNLLVICPDCETYMKRRTSMPQLEQFRVQMDITFPQGLRDD